MKNRVETFINLFVVCLLLGLLVTNARAEIDKHTIAIWLFEEGKGNKVEDVSGNTSRLVTESGDAYAREKGVEHNVLNLSDQEVRFTEIELL